MLLTKRQTMEKLGLGEIRLLRLVREGELADVGVTQAGGCRHNYKFQLRDVEALKRRLGTLSASNGQGNGHAVQAPLPVAKEPAKELALPVVSAPPPALVVALGSRLTTIERRLAQIETSLLDLVQLWR